MQLGAVDYISTFTSPAIVRARVCTHLSIKEARDRLANEIEERKKLEQALKESEEKFRAMVETTSDCIWETDEQARFTYLSPRFLDITGYQPAEFLQKTPLDLAPKEDGSRIAGLVSESLADRKPFQSIEHPICHREGKQVIVEISGVPIFSPDGSFCGVRGITRDTTKRYEAEKRLRDSEERFHAIFDNALSGIFFASPDGSIFAVNNAASNILGWSEREICAEGRSLIIDLSDPRLSAALAERQRTGSFHGELTFRRKNGSTFPVEVSSTLFTLQTGELRTVVIFQDISGRKQAEESLKLYQSIVQTSGEAIAVCDNQGQFIYINPAHEKLFGRPLDQARKLNFRDYYPDKSIEILNEFVMPALTAGKGWEGELNVFDDHGREFPLWERADSIFSSSGEMLYCFGIMHDITYRKKMEEQQQQIFKAESLNRMAGAIAHIFNNQLYVVIGNLELLLDSLPLGSENHDLAINAIMASHKAADVSKMLLTYLGQSPSVQESVDMSEICHKGMLIQQNFIPNNISVKTDIPFPGPIVHANTKQIQEVLTHLITNAQEAIADQQGTITLSVKTALATDIPVSNRFPVDFQPKECNYACLEISDTGVGIPKEDIVKVFDPFFTTKFVGSGLGLSVVLGTVGAHGGAITVESKSGEGCVFRVFLPVHSKTAPVAIENKAAEQTVQAGGMVLLVEDHDQVRNMAKVMLSRLGYTVLEAVDGVDAVEKFQLHKDKVRFIITDLTMPRMNGWDTLDAIHKISPDVPVILSSGYDEAKVMAVEHNVMPNAFLGKPYRKKDLDETIRQVLGKTNDRFSLFDLVDEVDSPTKF